MMPRLAVLTHPLSCTECNLSTGFTAAGATQLSARVKRIGQQNFCMLTVDCLIHELLPHHTPSCIEDVFCQLMILDHPKDV